MPQDDSVTRRIVFYGLRVQRRQESVPPDFGYRVRAAISSLDKNVGEHLQDRLGSAEFMAAFEGRHNGHPTLQLGAIRNSDFPQIHSLAGVRDLDLDPDEGLMEISHIVFFDNGVVGAEYNFRGPKVPWLSSYLREKCPELEPVKAHVLMRQEAAEQVRRMSSYTAVDIEISKPALAVAHEGADGNSNLFDTLDANADLFGGEHIKLTVTHQPRHRETLRTGRIGFIRGLVANRPLVEAARKLQVTGFDPELGREVVVNVLSDHLVSSAVVAKVGRNKVVATRDMCDAIVNAYNAMRDEIDQAWHVELAQ